MADNNFSTGEMNALAKLEQATKMLSEVRSAKDAFHLANMAAAAEHYARKEKFSQESINNAHAINIEATRLIGKYWKPAAKQAGGRDRAGGRSRGSHRDPLLNAPPTLADLGLTKKVVAKGVLLDTLAKIDPRQYVEVKDNRKTVTAARREMQRAKSKEAAALPTEKYRVLYADPPWRYNDQLTDQNGPTRFHYPSMSLSELCALPVSDIAMDDAVLFLWTTSPMLPDAFPVVKAWGFDYRASFVWDKVRHNMGRYNSVRHEFLLVCIRGSCLPDIPELIDSVQSIPRTTHSTKPEEFRAIIDRLYPHGKRIELFARTAVKGWNKWGNQA